MNKLGLKKTSSKRKGERIKDRIIILPINHKYIKNKKAKKLNFFEKFCCDNDLFIKTTS